MGPAFSDRHTLGRELHGTHLNPLMLSDKGADKGGLKEDHRAQASVQQLHMSMSIPSHSCSCLGQAGEPLY